MAHLDLAGPADARRGGVCRASKSSGCAVQLLLWQRTISENVCMMSAPHSVLGLAEQRRGASLYNGRACWKRLREPSRELPTGAPSSMICFTGARSVAVVH